ncbi:MAG TPA: methyltransferase domain-containing protein [Solirubrobacteraceae bacterium]
MKDNSEGAPYDKLGAGHTATRRPDPRIAAQIHQALGDAHSIANVGAGTGMYEPYDRMVLPIATSQRRIAQRAPELERAIIGHAESLPLASGSVDAAMALLTLHQWADWRVGVQELRRVARKRVVILTYDRSYTERFWLLRDYLPKLGQLMCARLPEIEQQCAAAGEEVRIDPVPVPHDCVDGCSIAAYWRRPSAYLDEDLRSGIPSFQLRGAERLLGGLDRLAEDLRSGNWAERNSDILECPELDLGYRLLVCEL